MSSYSKIENAFQKPSLDTLIIIAEKLDISIDYIVRGLKGKEPSNADNMDKIALLLDFLDSDKLRYIHELASRLAKIKDE
jgi:transcriptional regulator with XRE-family HTH domain